MGFHPNPNTTPNQVTDSQRFTGGQAAFTEALLEQLPPVRALSRWHARCVPASNPSNTARFFFCAQAEREEAAAALSWQATQG